MMKQTIFSAAVLASTLMVGQGCSKSESAVAEAETPVAAKPAATVESDIVALPPAMKDQDVVVSVGDKSMTWGELNTEVDNLIAEYTKQSGQPIPADQLPQAKQYFRRKQISNFIQDNVLAFAIKDCNVVLTEEWKKSQIAEIEKENGKSYEELIKDAPMGREKAEQVVEQRMLEMKLLQEKVLNNVKVTDAEVAEAVEKTNAEVALVKASMEDYLKQIAEKKATFEDLVKANSMMKEPTELALTQLPKAIADSIATLKPGEISALTELPGVYVVTKLIDRTTGPSNSVEASHILVKVDDPKNDAAAKAKIEDIRAKLLAGGDFAKLAQEFSDCPSKAQGGSLGEFQRGAMVPEFENAAFTQKVGEIGPVIKTQFGYHIVKVTKHADNVEMVKILSLIKQIPAVESAEAIKTNLEDTRKRDAAMKFFDEQKAKAGVKCPLFPELQ